MVVKSTADDAGIINTNEHSASSYDSVIGVDVASRSLDLFYPDESRHVQIENSVVAVTGLARRIQKSGQRTLVVMEATGGYENVLVDALHDANIDCAVVNPLRVRQFAQSCGKLEKTDRIDACVIAEFGALVTLKLKQKPSPAQKTLRALVHRRDQILSQSGAEQNRLKQTTDPDMKEDIQLAVDFYKKQLHSIDGRIAKVIREHDELAVDHDILASCPGVGVVTIAVLLAELPELGRFKRGQAAKLVGVAPIARDSGLKEGRRKTAAGRAPVRKVLYMAALVATRHNPRMKRCYQDLIARGKPKKVALVAVMRKLIITLNAMLRDHKSWSETPLALDIN